jgi:Sulfotransferase domain
MKKMSTWNLKILIASTPKTGNTWLKSLLASVYQLPMVDLPLAFSADAAEECGRRWIAHQHYMVDANLLTWAKQHKVVLITTIRHPGDVLVSLYHYVHNYHTTKAKEFGGGLTALVGDQDKMGQHTLAFVEDFYFILLNISITWMYAGASQVVRYEDLWRDPIGVLEALTARIQPVARDVIERAVDQHDITLVRKLSGANALFFRQGSIGGWHDAIPAPIVDRLRDMEPYPALFTALGYTLDPHDPLMTLPAKPRISHNPFRDTGMFSNGVAAPPITARLYLSFELAEARKRWPNPTDVQAPRSFFAWLNAPAEQEPSRAQPAPLISNLAAYIYNTRPGMHAKYPDVYSQNRLDWIFWFIRVAPKEYMLDDSFVEPLRTSLLDWFQQPAPTDPNRSDALPPITNLAVHIYQLRPDVQAVYPDLYGADRVKYLLWVLQNGLHEHKFEPIFVQRFREHFLAWVNDPAPDVPQSPQPLLLITRLAAHLYRTRADLQQTFTDPFGKQRIDYVTWFVGEYAWIPGVTRSTIQSWAQGYLNEQSVHK